MEKFNAHFERINTLSLKDNLRLACSPYPIGEQIAALESLIKELIMINRIRINNIQYGRKVDERPDEINLKYGVI